MGTVDTFFGFRLEDTMYASPSPYTQHLNLASQPYQVPPTYPAQQEQPSYRYAHPSGYGYGHAPVPPVTPPLQPEYPVVAKLVRKFPGYPAAVGKVTFTSVPDVSQPAPVQFSNEAELRTYVQHPYARKFPRDQVLKLSSPPYLYGHPHVAYGSYAPRK
eukprot:NODE_2833_length_635_cov_135.005119_g2357_i0.p1 GENE.NODE_2833_length_635_cov_135.005119_g2357_i0~~NODE_2833_length_635_cov_135.005119_g2357_i0.p1  ORF type:complete len:159 (+),score=16.10 NODE_2833_length_635_cov_135.005119_g2357_i0:30-506(+)